MDGNLSLRILMLDDDAACLEIVERMLRECQHEVVAVRRVSDALSILRERRGEFDMVLTDICMPDMDGFALIEHIVHEFKLPVIVMSADNTKDVMIRCLQSGALFFLVKPLSMNDLKRLWQYVYRKRIEEVEAIEQRGSISVPFSPDTPPLF